jgi:hypothetical protein
MRVFWIMVGLLVVAAVVAFRPHGGDAPASSKEAPTATIGPNPAAAPSAATRQPSAGASTPTLPASAAAAPGSKSEPDAQAQALVSDLTGSTDDQSDDDSGNGIDDALSDGVAPSPRGSNPAFDPAHPVDGTYIVRGSGTKDDPFEITWDLLLLASQTYIPREGRTDIPPQVKAIDGRQIRIAGYFAFPLASTDAREVLFMLNQWDGCCVGVPPTPFDAIEVRLKEPSDGRKQYVSYGTLSGVIKVDPYVQEGWLLGMYLMQDGVIDAGL